MSQRGQKRATERVMDRMESHPVCLKIGVTAHRDLSHVDSTSIERQVRDFFSSLRKNYPDLPLVVLNPLAPGGDMLVARVAVDMGIPLEVPLPMPLEAYEKDYSSPQLLQEFRELCSAGTVFELPLVAEYTLDDIQEHGKPRNLQYAHMGTYIAGHSHILLALWDGEKSEAVGGTASLVHFQLTGFMTGIAEERRSERLLSDKESDIVYHIECPRRDGVTGAAEGRWMSQSICYPGVEIPERYRTTFAYMQEFLRDSIRHKDAIDASTESLISSPQMENDPNLLVINDVYRRADWLAIYYRKLVLGELFLTHGLAILMGISFIVYSEYMELFFLLPAFLMFF
jgi:hypothetical protein